MGLFGPSKEELKADLAAALADKEKIVNDFGEWKRTKLNPHLAELKAKIAEQEKQLDTIGALDHMKRLEAFAQAQRDLEVIEAHVRDRRTSIQRELQLHRSSAEDEKRRRTNELNDELARLKQDADSNFSEYKRRYDESYAALTRAFTERQLQVQELDGAVINLTEAATLQDFGFFDYSSPAQSSVQLADELERVRSRIKLILKADTAATVIQDFTFNGSKAKGKKFANDMKKLMLRAYNAEAENAIKSVRAGNIETASKRLDRTREVTQNLGKFIELTISQVFHGLRLREIELANEHLKVLQIERENEREQKAILREEARAEAEIKKKRLAKEEELKRIERELEAARLAAEQRKRERLEKERDHYENVAESPEVQADEKIMEAIQEKLKDAKLALEDLDYREANAKAGYVYVLSNIGAFGQEVVKIGMTRRLEPKDRVKELSGASVPFIFDTHLMVFSQNARGLEHELHKHFSAVRVNKVNPRKEYFYTTPEAVLEVLKRMDVTVVEFTKDAEAEEYRSGLGAKAGAGSPVG